MLLRFAKFLIWVAAIEAVVLLLVYQFLVGIGAAP